MSDSSLKKQPKTPVCVFSETLQETSLFIMPYNQGAFEHQHEIRFNCSFLTDQEGPEYLEWVIWRNGHNQRISLNQRIHYPSGSTKYEIIASSSLPYDASAQPKQWTGRYDLVVKNIDMEDGVQYECCTLLEKARVFVELLVLGKFHCYYNCSLPSTVYQILTMFPDPVPTCDLSDELKFENSRIFLSDSTLTIKEGEKLKLNCSTRYAGAWPPSFKWVQDGLVTTQKGLTSNNEKHLAYSIYSMTAEIMDHRKKVKCVIFFEHPPDGVIRYAGDERAPDIGTSCTLTLDVLCELTYSCY